MYRPFCVQDNSFRHNHNLLIYTSCIYSFAESISSTQQKQTKRVGQGRGVCHPFAKNSWQPPYPCFCLISLASTTDELIFESYVLVIPHLSYSSLLTFGFFYTYISLKISQSHICPYRYISHCLNSQAAAPSLNLTNYKAI